MPAEALIIIIILLIAAVIACGIYILLLYLKKKQAEGKILRLEHDLKTANTLLAAEIEKFKTVSENSQYEKYAGAVLAQLDRAVVIINQNRTIGLLNEAAKQLLDLTASTGMPYKDVLRLHIGGDPYDYGAFEAAFAGTRQELPDNIELTSQHGTTAIGGSVVPLKSDQSVDAVICIFEDTGRQQAKAKQEQDFFSAAAHELRTPLTVIRMTISLLKDKFDTLPKEKIAEHLRRTDETTERLVHLVNQFLDISRIDQGRVEMKIERFDIVALTDEVIANMMPLAKERHLYINHELDVEQRSVVGDRSKSAEVLTNLIGNSLKYTIQGGITVTHAISDVSLTTNVTDTGSGIPGEVRRLLFQRFSQVGEAQARQAAKSTGLGLYISKQLAKLMRGDVTLVKSEPGMGTTFAFTLPLG